MEVSQQTDVDVSQLLPEQHLRRKLPVNLESEHLSLFQPDLETVIPASKLLVIHDVSASAEGMLFKAGQILPESFAAPFLKDQWKTRSYFKFMVSNYLLKSKRTIDTDVTWIVDDWSGGYYHWLADTLPRLLLLRDRLGDLTLLMPFRFRDLEFVTSSLAAFPLRRVEFVSSNERVFCPRLIVPMHTAPTGNHNEEVIRGLRALLVNFFSAGEAAGSRDRIYISRQQAPKRRIINEPEVIEILEQLDFQIVHAESLTFAQQAQLLSSARYLISNHGAGLTNMIFMPPKSNVLELRHKENRSYNCYFNLASSLDLNYFYQTCEIIDRSEDAHTADIIVDIRRLEQNVLQMLEF
jgi:Glycosyltransferase 61